tara:strand:+ start:175 stop:411 length:237 start_codon:yes stop_codon:yes gene_type:complete
MPAYKYNVGDLVLLNDDNVVLIVSLTNACEYMAIESNSRETLMKTFMNVPIYKVIINSTMSYINESNIKELILCPKEK